MTNHVDWSIFITTSQNNFSVLFSEFFFHRRHPKKGKRDCSSLPLGLLGDRSLSAVYHSGIVHWMEQFLPCFKTFYKYSDLFTAASQSVCGSLTRLGGELCIFHR
jgi:hypothetical protein